jgi:hypothetical protein
LQGAYRQANEHRAGARLTRLRLKGRDGWGGSFGCADTEATVSIGYVLNQMGDGIVGDPRATALCDRIYSCL